MFIREFVTGINEDKNELPFDVEDDLVVYMRNDPIFYRKHYFPTVLKMQSAHNAGKSLNSTSLWIPVIKSAIVPYINQYNINKNPEEILNKDKIRSIANKIYSDEINNIKNGSYE